MKDIENPVQQTINWLISTFKNIAAWVKDKIVKIMNWAVKCLLTPRQYHIYLHSKKYRVRKKYLKRAIQRFQSLC